MASRRLFRMCARISHSKPACPLPRTARTFSFDRNWYSDIGKRFLQTGRGGSTFHDLEQDFRQSGEEKDQDGYTQTGREPFGADNFRGNFGGRGGGRGNMFSMDFDEDNEPMPQTAAERRDYLKCRERNLLLSKFQSTVVDVNRTFKVTKGGGEASFTALVVCGNGEGVVGWAKGKAPKAQRAIKEASTRALNNLHYFERFKDATIYHYVEAKYEKSKVRLWPNWTLGTFRAGGIVRSILQLAGITSVKSKLIGSANPYNTVRATFLALSKIKTPKEYEEKYWRAVVEKHLILDQDGKPIPEYRKFNSWIL